MTASLYQRFPSCGANARLSRFDFVPLFRLARYLFGARSLPPAYLRHSPLPLGRHLFTLRALLEGPLPSERYFNHDVSAHVILGAALFGLARTLRSAIRNLSRSLPISIRISPNRPHPKHMRRQNRRVQLNIIPRAMPNV